MFSNIAFLRPSVVTVRSRAILFYKNFFLRHFHVSFKIRAILFSNIFLIHSHGVGYNSQSPKLYLIYGRSSVIFFY